MSTRSTVKMPGVTTPGSVRVPSGPPITSVKFRRRVSLRLGTTMRGRRPSSGAWVSCMGSSLQPAPFHGGPPSAQAANLLVHQHEYVISMLLQQAAVKGTAALQGTGQESHDSLHQGEPPPFVGGRK